MLRFHNTVAALSFMCFKPDLVKLPLSNSALVWQVSRPSCLFVCILKLLKLCFRDFLIHG